VKGFGETSGACFPTDDGESAREGGSPFVRARPRYRGRCEEISRYPLQKQVARKGDLFLDIARAGIEREGVWGNKRSMFPHG
jgi:hypothetical protein